MSEKPPSDPCHYQIVLEGHLDGRWADWFEGLSINYEYQDEDITILTGPIADQAALRGLLNQIWDFNLALIAVKRLHENQL